MKTKVSVPVHGLGQGQQIQVNFPLYCVYCCAPAGTRETIEVGGSKRSGHWEVSYKTQLMLPYCFKHAEVNERYRKLLKVVGLPVFLIAAISWFFLMMPFKSLVENLPINIIFVPLIFPCISNLIVGMAAVLLFHGLLQLFVPAFRDVPSIFSDGALGVTIKLLVTKYGASRLEFQFTNKEHARAFAQVNEVVPAKA